MRTACATYASSKDRRDGLDALCVQDSQTIGARVAPPALQEGCWCRPDFRGGSGGGNLGDKNFISPDFISPDFISPD
eukprot:6706572-Prymnesium_polylepis.1